MQGSDVIDGTGQIWLDNVMCTGSETEYTLCPNNGFGGHNCSHDQDVGVICSGNIVNEF